MLSNIVAANHIFTFNLTKVNNHISRAKLPQMAATILEEVDTDHFYHGRSCSWTALNLLNKYANIGKLCSDEISYVGAQSLCYQWNSLPWD